MSVIDELKYNFKNGEVFLKIIYINVFIFVFGVVIELLLYLLGIRIYQNYFILPSSFQNFIWSPWSIITYSFMHSSIFHLFFNMVFLYFIGGIFFKYLGRRTFLELYFLGSISGGLVFIVFSYMFADIHQNKISFLIGSSASIMAVLSGLTTHIPNYPVRIFNFKNLKLWHITAFLALLDFMQIPEDRNQGGHFAHIGGLAIGYLYIKKLHDRKYLNLIIDKIKSYLKPKPNSHNTDKQNKEKVDSILEKISKSGYDSLTKSEKDFLFNNKNDQ
ncbi:rhomboid family intramembrane serine protease [Ichthyobacterium seriolicida]|uniref:Rhomboid family protein n=1 Tax=Ichthyobacterium seriolicida TaxID=242600 RepID=A0A1J1E888_9FLAO|nr:rhomboid family intramembrane serine protease [Ichthyobacterium seriolicida]BAV94147.1 rhomboid family protein [Ichthyobacterium seriolicida]